MERHHVIHLESFPNFDAVHWNHGLWTAGQRHGWGDEEKTERDKRWRKKNGKLFNNNTEP